MNRAVLTLACVAVVLGTVASACVASKLASHRRPHLEHGGEHEHEREHDGFEHESHHLEHPHHSGGHSGGHSGRSGHFGGGDEGFEHGGEGLEHRHGGFHGHHGGHGSHGGHGGHEFGGEHEGHLEGFRQPIRRPIHKGLKGASKGIKRGGLRSGGGSIGGAGIGGAAGGFREHDSQAAGLEKNTRLGDRKSISGKKGFVASDKKGIEGDFHHHADREDAGIHKQQILNRNKVFIKDQTTGVNKVDGFRHSDSESDSGHIAAGDSKFVGAGASGKITSDKEFDRNLRAGISNDESSEGHGIVGGAGIGGASFD